ncbi:hypothetical protein BpHYR1_026548 [Brachionus plicatilis]|uniref:Uncharacterized protein n=1 Tax=Brachionus plicatilis TaxID=10195 RepID=A0A3M7SD31_BRAPC|nr:hypothetical protein BpHYR1_026548 [Brachionus plicatilis]
MYEQQRKIEKKNVLIVSYFQSKTEETITYSVLNLDKVDLNILFTCTSTNFQPQLEMTMGSFKWFVTVLSFICILNTNPKL